MAKTLFDTLYSAAEEVVKTMQKPAREKMLKRVAERIGDEIQDKQNEAELEISDLEHTLANTKDEDNALKIYKQIVTLRREVEEAKALADAIVAEKNYLFSAVEA